jgi:hypothetical protein
MGNVLARQDGSPPAGNAPRLQQLDALRAVAAMSWKLYESPLNSLKDGIGVRRAVMPVAALEGVAESQL